MSYPSSDFNTSFREPQSSFFCRERRQEFGGGNNKRAAAQAGDKIHLATFSVGMPVLSMGLVRKVTLFPISMKLTSTDSSMCAVPDVPIGPHELGVDTGIRRHQWAQSSSTTVDRRYSELVELRELLVYQFPTMIVPPLPPKSKLDNFATYQQNDNILLTQRHSIVRFLREVAMTPEFMYYSSYIPGFFQLPREVFEDWFSTARQTLLEFRRRNASIDAHTQRRGGGGLLGSESVTALTDGSTKVVRKIVGILHAWVGGGGGGPQKQQKQQQHASAMPRNQFKRGEVMAYWNEQMEYLTASRTALLEATRPYLLFIENSLESVAAAKEVAEALAKYAKTLSGSLENAKLASLARESREFTLESVAAVEGMHARNKREMYDRMLFEVAYIDAALDAIDHMLCVWRFSAESIGERTGSAGMASYAEDVGSRLREHYERRFLPNFRRRMHCMIGRNVGSGCDCAKSLEERIEKTAFVKTMRDASHSEHSSGSSLSEGRKDMQ